MIPDKRKGIHFSMVGEKGERFNKETKEKTWLQRLKKKHEELFFPRLGMCKNYLVRSIPFMHTLPWKQQPPNRLSESIGEEKVLQEVEKVV